MLYVCPSLYREKWLLQKLFDFPLPFLSSSFKKPKQDFILGPRKIEILSITMVLHFWETSCRYQGCQLWGLLLFGDLKGPYYFIIISTGAIDDDVGQILEPLLVGINLVNVTVWHEQCLARNCIVWHLHFSLRKLLIVDITVTPYEMNKMALGNN